MRRLARVLVFAAMAAMLAGTAQAYYFFVHYVIRDGVMIGAREKFDLGALLNKTVPFLINYDGLQQTAPGDSLPAITSQLRLAAETWNGVSTSDLRISYGGIISAASTPSAGPYIEIVFSDLPPGLVAQGGPTLRGDVTADLKAPFVPISRSTVILNKDLAAKPSYREAFFLTAVHEIGHTLGLQHTLTSSVMSTEITRGTTKSLPLGADDIAGISALYPKPGFAESTGGVSGRVDLSGAGVALASVVALSPDGTAVSALTGPDGTYNVDGLAPGTYYLYVHPLPPPINGEYFPDNITPSLDPDGNFIPAFTGFGAQIYPGVQQFVDAEPLVVTAGKVHEGVNFSVGPRTSPKLYGITTYSYPGQLAVKPGTLSTSGGRNFIIAAGYGLSTTTANVSVVGGSASVSAVKAYSPAPAWTQLDFSYGFAAGEGARHLLFNQGGELYLLPSAFRLTKAPPPSVKSVDLDSFSLTAGSKTLKITGTGLSLATGVLFDGVKMAPVSAAADGTSITVEPPPAPAGHRAAVVALNPDGQSSLYVADPPVSNVFEDTPLATFSLNTAEIPAGSESMIEVVGDITAFTQGLTSLAFNSGDVHVRRIWVLSQTRLLANIAVTAAAPDVLLTPSIQTGLRTANGSGALHIAPANPAIPFLRGPITAVATGSEDVPAGSKAMVDISALPEGVITDEIQITVQDIPVSVQSLTGNRITFTVPLELQPGPAVVRVVIAGVPALPLVMSVDLPAPAILSVLSKAAVVDHARVGDTVTLSVARVPDPTSEIAVARVKILAGGAVLTPETIKPGPNATQLVDFILTGAVAVGDQSIVVTLDGRPSEPVSFKVLPAATSSDSE